MVISTATFISDVIIFLRDLLRTNVTDPLLRTNGVGFVMTAFPKRKTQYPIITIRGRPFETIKLGMQSEVQWVPMSIEIDIFARNAKELDILTQNTINVLRTNEFGLNSTNVEEIHGFKIISIVPVTEEDGDNLIHRNSMVIDYKVILTG